MDKEKWINLFIKDIKAKANFNTVEAKMIAEAAWENIDGDLDILPEDAVSDELSYWAQG